MSGRTQSHIPAIGRNRLRLNPERGCGVPVSARKGDHGARGLPDHREDAARRAEGRGRRVLPAERAAGEALEPRLLLRPRRWGLQLEVEVRTARIAGVTDEADLRA